MPCFVLVSFLSSFQFVGTLFSDRHSKGMTNALKVSACSSVSYRCSHAMSIRWQTQHGQLSRCGEQKNNQINSDYVLYRRHVTVRSEYEEISDLSEQLNRYRVVRSCIRCLNFYLSIVFDDRNDVWTLSKNMDGEREEISILIVLV